MTNLSFATIDLDILDGVVGGTATQADPQAPQCPPAQPPPVVNPNCKFLCFNTQDSNNSSVNGDGSGNASGNSWKPW